MEAKDTVMSNEQIKVEVGDSWCAFPMAVFNKLVEAQAEISFTLGEEQGRQAGIKEVVEFVNDWTKRCPLVLIDKIALNEALGIQLKEWGISK